LYLALEFCPGGELFYHLHQIGRFTEEQAKFYFAEVVLALGYLHEQDILYRDLKPENILLDADGHIRITDFGVSKENISASTRRYSFCGSPEYMSPEMLRNKGHSRSLDFYTLGAFLYEMLTGLPPFYCNNKTKMYKVIQTEEVAFPSYLSRAACGLISRLLDKTPETRLGARSGVEEVKAHPWCVNVPWDRILAKTKSPPFAPNLRQSNFDQEYTSLQLDFPDYETPVLEFRGSFTQLTEDPFADFVYPKEEPSVSEASVVSVSRKGESQLSGSWASQSTKATVKRDLLDSESFRRHDTVYIPEASESHHGHHNSQEFLADRVLMLQRSQAKRYQSPLHVEPQPACDDVLNIDYRSPKFCSPPAKVHGPAFTAVKVEQKRGKIGTIETFGDEVEPRARRKTVKRRV